MSSITRRDSNLDEIIPFPEGEFDVLLSDCAWEYDNKKTGGSMKSGAKHIYGSIGKYQVMSLEELKSLPVSKIANKDSVMFCWATAPMLPEALEVLKAWGFEYKTVITWFKKPGRLGMGSWMRVQTEFLLVGIKGKVKAFHSNKKNIIITYDDDPEVQGLEEVVNEGILVERPATRHSAKPKIFYQLIEELTANMKDRKFVELFARGVPAKGWTGWGNQVINDHPLMENFIETK